MKHANFSFFLFCVTLEALHTKSVYFIIFNPYDWGKIGWFFFFFFFSIYKL